MTLKNLLQWYRQLFVNCMPAVSHWIEQDGFYVLKFSDSYCLCATSSASHLKIEFCHGGPQGESLTTHQHSLDASSGGSGFVDGFMWVQNCVSMIQREIATLMSQFTFVSPIVNSEANYGSLQSISTKYQEGKETNPIVIPHYYPNHTQFVLDDEAFPIGSVVVFLYRSKKDALDLATSLVLGEQKRTQPVHNPAYYFLEEDATSIVSALKRENIPKDTLDHLRFIKKDSPESINLFQSIVQVAIFHLHTKIEDSNLPIRFREMSGCPQLHQAPFYNIFFVEASPSLDDSIKAITDLSLQIDGDHVVSNIYMAHTGYHLEMVWRDPKAKIGRMTNNKIIQLPLFET